MEKSKVSKPSVQKNGKIDLIEIFAVLWSEKKIIICITGVFTILAIFYALLATPWYSASVKIMPGSSEKSGGLINQYAGLAAMAGINIPASSNNFELYPEIIKSSFILNRILEHRFYSSLYEKPVTLFEFWETEIDSTESDWEHVLWEEAKKTLREDYIDANIDKKNSLLKVTVNVPRDPALAAELANYVAKNLDLYNKHFRKYKAADQINYIVKSLEATESELKKAANKLKKFLDENKNYSSPEKKFIYEKINTEYEVQKTIYIELRKQKELSEIEKIKETETLNILENATTPIKRSKPRRTLIVILMTFLGFFFSLIYIIIAKLYLENREKIHKNFLIRS